MRPNRLLLPTVVIVFTVAFPPGWSRGHTAAGQQPAAGQLHVTSEPSGLKVHLERHETTPKTNLMRTGDIEKDSPRGQTPLVIDLAPGDYTVAVEQALTLQQASKVPRGCRSGFSISGSTMFFECFKCNSYPDDTFLDSADPFARDGNIGVCFDAPSDEKVPVKYFRLYKLIKGDTAARLQARFKPRSG